MNKTELVAAIAEQAEISKKDAEKAVKAFTMAFSASHRPSAMSSAAMVGS